ncbi:MAG TPA: CopG family transcriptional regulator [Burkholderiales bacterium]|nr:CopG family transcriptional regulator [Burkholderiales bacterium]
MPATTIKLPPELKERVAAVIEGTGKSAHAFMVEAIERQTAIAERRKEFVAEALAAERQMLKTGRGYAAEDVHAYLEAKAQHAKVRRPKAKRWRA